MTLSSHRYRYLATIIWIGSVPWLLWPSFAPVVSALALLLLLLVRLGARRWLGQFVFPTAINGFLLLYLALVAVAFVVSPVPELSLPKLTVTVLGAFGFFLVQDWLAHPAGMRWLNGVLALAGGAIAVLTPFIIRWPDRQVVDLRFLTERIPHLTGSFAVHSNEIGGTLLFLLPFGLVLAGRRDSPRWWRPAGGVATLLMGIGLLLSQSRGAWLGAFVMIVAWVLWSRFSLRSAALGAGLLLFVLLLSFPVLGLEFGDVSAWARILDARSKTGPAEPVSWLMRAEIWRAGGQMLRDYPVFGAGLNGFVPVSRANYVYETVPPDMTLAHAHNLLLQMGASLGWAGLLALVGIWGTVAYGLWYTGRVPDTQLRCQASVYGASLVGYLAFNLFDVISLGQRPGILLWLVLAGGVAVARFGRVVQVAPRPGAQALRYAPLVPLLVLAGLCLTPALPRNVANWQLDRVLLADKDVAELAPGRYQDDPRRQGIVAYRQGNVAGALAYWQTDPQAPLFLQSQGRIAAADEDLEAAVFWYDLALTLDDTLATAYFWRGVARNENGNPHLALADFDAAAYHAPRDGLSDRWQATILFHLGQTRVDHRQWHRAVEAFEQAIALEADEPIYYRRLGEILEIVGDESGAAAAYQKARERD